MEIKMENEGLRLVADRMLEGLARRLRLAGYDCARLPEVFRTPQAISEHARSEGRLLLTTSNRTLGMAGPQGALQVPEGPPGEQAEWVMARLPIDFKRLAFTRCSRDNTLLEDAGPAAEVPPRVRQAGLGPVRQCPVCGRLYWPGSHVERIRRGLLRER